MRQVFLFVFLVGEQKIDFIILYEVVNNPDSATLSSSLCRPTNLPQATAASYDVARFRVESERNLKTPLIGIRQESIDLLGENRSFDEMHNLKYTPMAYSRQAIFFGERPK